MAISCAAALTSNFSTQVANMDLNIKNQLQTMLALKNYSLASSSANAANAAVDAKYASGFYVSPSYPSIIPVSALNAAGINGYNDTIFFNNHISHDGGQLGTCPYVVPGSTEVLACNNVSNYDTACCACRTNSSGGHNSFCDGTFGCNTSQNASNTAPGSLCYKALSTNLFQSSINSEKAAIQANITNLYNTWNAAGQAVVNNMTLVQIGCCQNIVLGNVDATQVTYNNITNTCTLNGQNVG